MTPARPPPPTPCKRPFHPVDGIQTSTLMSETALGRKVAVSRQKDGRFVCAAEPSGGLNVPAGTVAAEVMTVFGSPASVGLVARSEQVSAIACVSGSDAQAKHA